MNATIRPSGDSAGADAVSASPVIGTKSAGDKTAGALACRYRYAAAAAPPTANTPNAARAPRRASRQDVGRGSVETVGGRLAVAVMSLTALSKSIATSRIV